MAPALDGRMAVTLGADVLSRFRRFSLFNSPYVAHDEGRAIDLYPPADAGRVPSPVAGEVREVRTVRAPPRAHAAATDQLLVVDTGAHLARLLHVDADVEPGATLAVGDPLGRPIRAGFFAPWVPAHVHCEFRPPEADPYRARGSLPIEVDVPLAGLTWDGTGRVVVAGDTWARLDRPAHPAPGEHFVGLAGGGGVLDGGLAHYDRGGTLGGRATPRFLGTRLGSRTGRVVDWADVSVAVDATPVAGLACFCARDRFGATLVGRSLDLAIGDRVTVRVERN